MTRAQLHDVTDKEFEHDLRYERLFKEFFYLMEKRDLYMLI